MVEETNQHDSAWEIAEAKRRAKEYAELVALGYDRRDTEDTMDKILNWHMARFVSRPMGKEVLDVGHVAGSGLVNGARHGKHVPPRPHGVAVAPPQPCETTDHRDVHASSDILRTPPARAEVFGSKVLGSSWTP